MICRCLNRSPRQGMPCRSARPSGFRLMCIHASSQHPMNHAVLLGAGSTWPTRTGSRRLIRLGTPGFPMYNLSALFPQPSPAAHIPILRCTGRSPSPPISPSQTICLEILGCETRCPRRKPRFIGADPSLLPHFPAQSPTICSWGVRKHTSWASTSTSGVALIASYRLLSSAAYSLRIESQTASTDCKQNQNFLPFALSSLTSLSLSLSLFLAVNVLLSLSLDPISVPLFS